MSDASQDGSARPRTRRETANDVSSATADTDLVRGAAESADRPIRVNLPPDPPELTPGAARVLLEILVELYEQERAERGETK
jgi:hypothetical protein